MKRIIKLLIFLALVIGGIYWYYSFSLNLPNSASAEIKSFTVQSGWGSQKISEELRKEGLIRNPIIFELYVWSTGVSGKLLPGDYLLEKNLSLRELAQILSRGAGATKEIVLTFIEGWNSKDYAKYLQGKGLIAKEEDFFDAVQKKADWWDKYDFLREKPKNLDLEGYLFPDTYRVFRDASLASIIQKMLDNLDSKLTEDLRREIKVQGKTIHEIITMASIVEKEVSSDHDRKMVADIFYKRLKAGIALQSDATVNYATGLKTTRPTEKDLSVDSLYNTYKYRDLPPGPICNPGLSAILAAIYPTGNPYLYFLTTPEGQIIYSRTHEEHVAAKAKYLK